MALTPESIASTWSNGGTVQIVTPADLNVFNGYLQTNYSAPNMRYAEITADLDFGDGEISFVPMSTANIYSSQYITNLTIDGNGHTIKGIVEDNLNAKSFFFWGDDNTTALQNIIIAKCNITNVYSNNPVVNRVGTINNVKLDHCRFTVTSSNGYSGLIARYVTNYSSAVTVYCNGGGDYYGVNNPTESKRIAMLDTVYRASTGGAAYALYYGHGSHSLAFTRNRFYNFATVVGVYRNYSGTPVSTTYAAITADNATGIYPLGGNGSYSTRPISSYYDKVLVPNAAAYTDLGLTTSELQSVATMTAKGFAVEEA